MKTATHVFNLITQWLLLFTIGIVGSLFLATRLGYLAPIRPYIVMSGSMAPLIKTGSLVLVMPRHQYSLGDIITFSSGGKLTTTHRLVDSNLQNGTVVYSTKGDANKSTDPGTITKDQIIGSLLLHLPYFGFAADFAKQPQGFILLVIVPATIITYEELQFIRREIRRQLKRRHKKVASPAPAALPVAPILVRYHNAPALPLAIPPVAVAVTVTLPTVKAPKAKPLDKRLLLIPSLACLAIFIGLTGSYFFDSEASIGNVLGAAATFASPVSHVLIPAPADSIPPTPTLTPAAAPSPTPTPILTDDQLVATPSPTLAN